MQLAIGVGLFLISFYAGVFIGIKDCKRQYGVPHGAIGSARVDGVYDWEDNELPCFNWVMSHD